MQKEDTKIRSQFGTENHFRVPEGYFDNLAASVMRNIPQQDAKIVAMPTPAWRKHIGYISAAAASVAAAVCLVLTIGHGDASPNDSLQAQDMSTQSEYSTMDEMAAYAMIDTDDMYAYMSDVDQ